MKWRQLSRISQSQSQRTSFGLVTISSYSCLLIGGSINDKPSQTILEYDVRTHSAHAQGDRDFTIVYPS
jgi:hypothetical protein